VSGQALETIRFAIDSAIAGVVGQSTARAINFYVDSRLAISDPDRYARSLSKIFGDGAKVLTDKIIDEVCLRSGLARSEVATIGEAVAMATERLASGKS